LDLAHRPVLFSSGVHCGSGKRDFICGIMASQRLT
jgi:hypothetical protein